MIPKTEKAPTMGKIVRASDKKRMTPLLYNGTEQNVNAVRCVCWLIRDAKGRRTVITTTHRGIISLLREGFLAGGI